MYDMDDDREVSIRIKVEPRKDVNQDLNVKLFIKWMHTSFIVDKLKN